MVVAVLGGAFAYAGTETYIAYRTTQSYEQHTTTALPVASPSVTSRPLPSSTATPVVPLQAIEQSAPVQLKVPSVGLDVEVLPNPCPVDDGMVHPPIDEAGKPCYYTAADKPYQLPGSSTTDLVAIFGHTGHCDADCAAFNRLYDWQGQQWLVESGDELYLRTNASGGSWLVYRASDFYTPDKYGDSTGSLANSSEVWGTQPQPNRLLTIGCLQSADGVSKSQQNIVISWTFDRVEKGAN